MHIFWQDKIIYYIKLKKKKYVDCCLSCCTGCLLFASNFILFCTDYLSSSIDFLLVVSYLVHVVFHVLLVIFYFSLIVFHFQLFIFYFLLVMFHVLLLDTKYMEPNDKWWSFFIFWRSHSWSLNITYYSQRRNKKYR